MVCVIYEWIGDGKEEFLSRKATINTSVTRGRGCRIAACVRGSLYLACSRGRVLPNAFVYMRARCIRYVYSLPICGVRCWGSHSWELGCGTVGAGRMRNVLFVPDVPSNLSDTPSPQNLEVMRREEVPWFEVDGEFALLSYDFLGR
jgi:hypothetical protein